MIDDKLTGRYKHFFLTFDIFNTLFDCYNFCQDLIGQNIWLKVLIDITHQTRLRNKFCELVECFGKPYNIQGYDSRFNKWW